MSHVTHVNESCHTYGWVMSHMCTSAISRVWHGSFVCVHSHVCVCVCVTLMCVKSYHACDMIHSQGMSHVTRVVESCHSKVLPHTWMGHVTDMNASRHTYQCGIAHVWIPNSLLADLHVKMNTYKYTCIWCIYRYTHIDIDIHIHIYMYMYMYMYMYLYI